MMIKFNKNVWFLYEIIFFLLIFNVSFIFKIIPVQIMSGLFGLLFLTGFLFSHLIKIQANDRLDNFLYCIGLSLVLDILFGLLLNTVLPLFGVSDPLSSQNLQIWISVGILISTISIIFLHNAPELSFSIPSFQNWEKICLIFGIFIFCCCLWGIFLVNIENFNLLLISSIFLIPLLLGIIIFCHGEKNNNIVYPIIIFLITISLLFLLALRSNYILGIDSHEEYFLFHQTFTNAIWIPDPSFVLSASLSISIMPTVFKNVLTVDPQILFKLLYPLISSITPLVIYAIAKKYVNELLALFASCFFIFQRTFIITSANSRTTMAIFFFAFAILVISNAELIYPKKYALIFLFIAGTVFSHYTTALIFLLILSLAYILEFIFKRYVKEKEYSFVNFPLVFLLGSMIFFWYQQMINSVFNTGIRYVVLRTDIFFALANNDISKYVPPPTVYTSFIQKIANYSRWTLYSLIGLGILFSIYNLFQKEMKRISFSKIFQNMDTIFLSIGFVSFGLLVATFFAAALFFGYDTGRIGELIFVVLSFFLIIGALMVFNLTLMAENLLFAKMKFYKKIQMQINYCKFNQNKIVSGILLLLLIPQIFLIIGISDQFFGGPYSIILNSPKYAKNIDFGSAYIFDQDAQALQWFKNNSDKNLHIISDDYGNKKITSLINQPSLVHQDSLISRSQVDIAGDCIFSSVTNEYYGRFADLNGNELPLSVFDQIPKNKNKIFTNGAVLYK